MKAKRAHDRRGKAAEAEPFAVRYADGHWQVKQGTNWRHVREVSLLAPAIGNGAGELVGNGVVTRVKDCAVITA